MQSRRDPALTLTARKVSIISLRAKGRSVQEIAHELGVSPETIYEHLELSRRRLGARNDPELIHLAMLHGFL